MTQPTLEYERVRFEQKIRLPPWMICIFTVLPLILAALLLLIRLFAKVSEGFHLLSIILLALTIGLAIVVPVVYIGLTIRVFGDRIELRYLLLRRIVWMRDMISVRVVNISPGEMGFGIRMHPRHDGWAYAFRGDKGVDIELPKRQFLYIATDRAEELAELILMIRQGNEQAGKTAQVVARDETESR